MTTRRRFLLTAACASPVLARDRMKALIVDGQNNHKWMETTPLLRKLLLDSGLFEVEVATSPEKGADLSGFVPNFAAYRVVVSNYNGESWSGKALDALAAYVRGGGGFVSFHAANNAFPEHRAYNEMIGLGGWGGRDEKSGPYLRMRGGKFVPDASPGRGGSHGVRHPFLIEIREPNHPITRGLPRQWMHEKDELYDRLRGPAENVTVLASAYSDPSIKGTGEHEPVLFTVAYGKGRVFHTTLGHDLEAMRCAGFQTTFQRGAEWAATGKVTQKVPADFPTASAVRLR